MSGTFPSIAAISLKHRAEQIEHSVKVCLLWLAPFPFKLLLVELTIGKHNPMNVPLGRVFLGQIPSPGIPAPFPEGMPTIVCILPRPLPPSHQGAMPAIGRAVQSGQMMNHSIFCCNDPLTMLPFIHRSQKPKNKRNPFIYTSIWKKNLGKS